MKFCLIFILLFLLSFNLFSQNQDTFKRCGTTEYQKLQLRSNPDLIYKNIAIESQINDWIIKFKSLKSDNEIIILPIIVHIVYNLPTENITDAQVYSQIDALNEDFRRLNYDAINTPNVFSAAAADCKIQFCLAQRTPDNKPTNGIVRRKTDLASFAIDDGDKVKNFNRGGDSIWNPSKYLNIWVCNLTGNIAGYTSNSPPYIDNKDGIVINYLVFGRIGNLKSNYNKGRTTSHEIGHWLDLYHVWGDNVNEKCTRGIDDCNCSDKCKDTPSQREANYGCPEYPHITCSDTSDMFMNFMDYSNDNCLNTFTHDQNTRMKAALNVVRKEIINSDRYIPLIQPPDVNFISDKSIIVAGKGINFNAFSNDNIINWKWVFYGAKPDSSNLQNPVNIIYSEPGAYTVTLVATTDKSVVKITKFNLIRVVKAALNKEIFIKNPLSWDNVKYKSDTLLINFTGGIFNNIEIRVFDILGKLIYANKMEDNEFVKLYEERPNSVLKKIILPPYYLKNGIYILQVITQNGVLNKKFYRMH